MDGVELPEIPESFGAELFPQATELHCGYTTLPAYRSRAVEASADALNEDNCPSSVCSSNDIAFMADSCAPLNPKVATNPTHVEVATNQQGSKSMPQDNPSAHGKY